MPPGAGPGGILPWVPEGFYPITDGNDPAKAIKCLGRGSKPSESGPDGQTRHEEDLFGDIVHAHAGRHGYRSGMDAVF